MITRQNIQHEYAVVQIERLLVRQNDAKWDWRQ